MKYCNCEETKDEFGGCVSDKTGKKCIACGHSIKLNKMKDNYKKYWKVTLIDEDIDGYIERTVFNRVEKLDDFFKNIDREQEFEIERLSKAEFEETEQ